MIYRIVSERWSDEWECADLLSVEYAAGKPEHIREFYGLYLPATQQDVLRFQMHEAPQEAAKVRRITPVSVIRLEALLARRQEHESELQRIRKMIEEI